LLIRIFFVNDWHVIKIVVVGKGGREHALVRALVESESKPRVFSFPGSDAILQLAEPVKAKNLPDLITWMKENAIDLCVAGEESYLVKDEGLANLCEEAGIPCWGPHKQSAQLEASKEFAKEFLLRHGIPTGNAVAVDDIEQARQAIGGVYPTVLKFDGLAAGKGVAVCEDETSAEAFLDLVLERRRFGAGRLLVEECLTGPELSIFAAVVDDQALVFTPARDYKRALDGDLGPNTGGMGAVASRQLIDDTMMAMIQERIIQPTIRGLNQDGLPYRGFLYFGLMLTPDGPKVIEYNCRFGDPECQAVMPLVSGDMAEFCLAGAKGILQKDCLTFSDDWSVCVILASAGYPEISRNGDEITGLEEVTNARVYHAGTKLVDTTWLTHGGRVLAVVAKAADRVTAAKRAHAEAKKINFAGAQSRSDIGIASFS
jgi:phosphoribosylamine---glycine ligase